MTTTDRPLLGRQRSSVAVWYLRAVWGGRPFDRRNPARLRDVTGAVLVGLV